MQINFKLNVNLQEGGQILDYFNIKTVQSLIHTHCFHFVFPGKMFN